MKKRPGLIIVCFVVTVMLSEAAFAACSLIDLGLAGGATKRICITEGLDQFGATILSDLDLKLAFEGDIISAERDTTFPGWICRATGRELNSNEQDLIDSGHGLETLIYLNAIDFECVDPGAEENHNDYCLFYGSTSGGVWTSDNPSFGWSANEEAANILDYRLSWREIYTDQDPLIRNWGPRRYINLASFCPDTSQSSFEDLITDCYDRDGDGLGVDCVSDFSCVDGIPTCYGVPLGDPLCSNSDETPAEPFKGMSGDDLPDCADFCTDVDGDFGCSCDSARPKIEEGETMPDFYTDQATLWYEKAFGSAQTMGSTIDCWDANCVQSAVDPHCCCCNNTMSDEYRFEYPGCCFTEDDYTCYNNNLDTWRRAVDPTTAAQCPLKPEFIVEGGAAGSSYEDYDSNNLNTWLSEEKYWDLCDTDDNDMSISPFATETCNLIDDDSDGVVDECPGTYPNSVITECIDGEDNDNDGLIDKFDPDCYYDGAISTDKWAPKHDNESSTADSQNSSCSDNLDNDGDGNIDEYDSDCAVDMDGEYLILMSQNYRPGSCTYFPEGEEACHIMDADGDGFKSVDFFCSDCTDCDDSDPDINPAMADDSVDNIDQNCNGLDGEQSSNQDDDNILDLFDRCNGEDRAGIFAIVDYFGCWISPEHKLLKGWSEI